MVPYLFGYNPSSAISRDPKLLTEKINLIDTNCKCIILGYKPRPILGLDLYYRLWNFSEVTNIIKQLLTSQETCLRTSEAFYKKLFDWKPYNLAFILKIVAEAEAVENNSEIDGE